MAYTPPDVVPLTGFEKDSLIDIFKNTIVPNPEVKLLVPDFGDVIRHLTNLDKERKRLDQGDMVVYTNVLNKISVPLDGSNEIALNSIPNHSIYTIVGINEFNGTFKVILAQEEGNIEVGLDSVVPLSLIGKMSQDNSKIIINPKILKVAEKLSHLDLNAAQRKERRKVMVKLFGVSLEELFSYRYYFTSIFRLDHRVEGKVETFIKNVLDRIEDRLIDPLTTIHLRELEKGDVVYFEEINEREERYFGIVQYLGQSTVKGVALPKCMVRKINKYSGKPEGDTIAYNLDTSLNGHVFKPKELKEVLRAKERLNKESRREMKLVLLDQANIETSKWLKVE